MSVMDTGDAKGQITLESTGWVQPSDVLKLHPSIKTKLDEITKKGWKYLFVSVTVTAEAEVVLQNAPFRIYGRRLLPLGRATRCMLELDVGEHAPALKAIKEVKQFTVNICSKSFPGAATVDLSKDTVTYIHDPFWKWEKGWESDDKKLSDAREVREIASWLLDVKKYKLVETMAPERYQELSALFREMPT